MIDTKNDMVYFRALNPDVGDLLEWRGSQITVHKRGTIEEIASVHLRVDTIIVPEQSRLVHSDLSGTLNLGDNGIKGNRGAKDALAIDSGTKYVISETGQFEALIRALKKTERGLNMLDKRRAKYYFVSEKYDIKGTLTNSRGNSVALSLGIDSVGLRGERIGGRDDSVKNPSVVSLWEVEKSILREPAFTRIPILGVKQLFHEQERMGAMFLVGEVGLTLWACNRWNKADAAYNKHKKLDADDLAQHKAYYKDYRHKTFVAAGLTAAAAGLLVWNIIHSSRIESKLAFTPTFMPTGEVGLSMSMAL